MAELSESEKATFKAATERRKAAGIKLGRITLLAEKSQVEGFNELWDSWVARWGKNLAVDHLIRIMGQVEARLQDKKRSEEH
jgi:hypothetical protein